MPLAARSSVVLAVTILVVTASFVPLTSLAAPGSPQGSLDSGTLPPDDPGNGGAAGSPEGTGNGGPNDNGNGNGPPDDGGGSANGNGDPSGNGPPADNGTDGGTATTTPEDAGSEQSSEGKSVGENPKDSESKNGKSGKSKGNRANDRGPKGDDSSADNAPPADRDSDRSGETGNGPQSSPEDRDNGPQSPPEDRGNGPPTEPGGEPNGNSPAADTDTPSGRNASTNTSTETPQGPPERLGRNGTYPAYDLDRSALAFRELALAELESADGPGNTARLASLVEGSLAAHRDGDRIRTGTVFETDTRIAAGARGRAPNATGYLVAADAVTVRTAIADAERVAGTLDERNISYNTTAVERQLALARTARDRGDRLRGGSVGAVQQYREAWGHAQRALDLMDEATEPTVTLGPRGDLPTNSTTTRRLNGTVFDVRGYELNATLSVNGRTRQVALNTSTVPGVVARYNTTTTLDRRWPNYEGNATADRSDELVLSARDPGRDYAPTALDEVEPVHGMQVGRSVLRLDGDGLPGRYERRVTGTDPLDADSDSNRTERDEADNATVDGAEDFDGDGLIAYREAELGTDPLDADTDGDGLTDGFEAERPMLDPLDADTDGDGIDDGAEDFDGDGVVNIDEVANGSNLFRADTDGDGLNDTEARDYGTDPTDRDTDDDGLSDASELELGTDPLVADSDGDGVPDGNETFTTETRDPGTGVTVGVTGEGDVADGITVRSVSENTTGETRRSTVVKLDSESSFDAATVTVPLGEGVDPGGDLAIYKLNPETNGTWERYETDIDAANMTATTTVDSFSYVAVYDVSLYEERATAELDLSWPAAERFDDRDGWTGDGRIDDGVVVLESSTPDDGTGDGDGSGSDTGGGDDDGSDDGGNSGGDDGGDTGDGGGDDGDDGPVDSDGDGIRDSNDLCPDTIGTFNGCPTDTDGDGINDFYDDCPFLSGSGDGCPDSDSDDDSDSGSDDSGSQDSDGDGVPDDEDACPDRGGVGTDGCPYITIRLDDDPAVEYEPQRATREEVTRSLASVDAATVGETASLSRSLDLSGVTSATFEARVGATVGGDGVARIVVTDGTTTVTVFETTESTGSFRTVSADVSDLGADATVELRTEGDAELRVDAIRIERDADGDGIPTVVEEAAADIPYPTFDSDGELVDRRLGLDPGAADTDGEGLADDVEVTVFRRFRLTSDLVVPATLLDGGVSVGSGDGADIGIEMYAHPNARNTDGLGLEDDEERAKGSDPRRIEAMLTGVDVPTIGVRDGEGSRPVNVADSNAVADSICVEPYNGACLRYEPYDEDFIMYPSDFQTTGPLKCFIADCPAWLSEVDVRSDRTYLYVPLRVYAVKNDAAALSDLPEGYRLRFTGESAGATIIDPETGRRGLVGGALPNDDSERIGVVIEVEKQNGIDEVGRDFYVNALEHLGQLEFEATGSVGVFERDAGLSSRAPYSLALAPGADATARTIETSGTIYEEGIEIASAFQGISAATTTRGAALIVLRNYAEAKADPTPGPNSFNTEALKVYANAVREVNEDIPDEVVDEGDAVIVATGPAISRVN